jgi:hypothetical protein
VRFLLFARQRTLPGNRRSDNDGNLRQGSACIVSVLVAMSKGSDDLRSRAAPRSSSRWMQLWIRRSILSCVESSHPPGELNSSSSAGNMIMTCPYAQTERGKSENSIWEMHLISGFHQVPAEWINLAAKSQPNFTWFMPADIRKCQIHLSNVHGQVNLHASRSFVSWQHRLTHPYMPRYFQFIVQDIMMVCVYAFALDAALSIITLYIQVQNMPPLFMTWLLRLLHSFLFSLLAEAHTQQPGARAERPPSALEDPPVYRWASNPSSSSSSSS